MTDKTGNKSPLAFLAVLLQIGGITLFCAAAGCSEDTPTNNRESEQSSSQADRDPTEEDRGQVNPAPQDNEPSPASTEEPVEEQGPDDRSDDGWPRLVEAAYGGDRLLVSNLLRQGADVNLTGPEGWTALMQTAGSGDMSTTRQLLEAGAWINAENGAGYNAYEIAQRRGHSDVAQYLKDQGAADEELRRFFGAAYRGATSEMDEMLDNGFDINRTDYRGRTALYYALTGDRDDRYDNYYQYSFRIRPETISYMLEEGADLAVRDNEGKTPLFAFVREYGANLTVIEILIEHGADPNTADNTGLGLLSRRCAPDFAQMLIDGGLDVNRTDQRGRTPLHWQVETGNEQVVRILRDAGADPTIQDQDGNTPDQLRP